LDGSRFDDLTRTLATSRRRALKTLLGGALAAAALGRGRGAVATPWAFYRVNQPCKYGEACGALAPCTDGVCTPIVCKIDGEIYQPGPPTEFGPENLCHVCDPTAGPDGWQQWTVGREGEGCAIALDEGCDPVYFHCVAGSCLPQPEPGQTLPGGERCLGDEFCCHGVCCQGVCCGLGQECGSYGCVKAPIDFD
jgi:hypothetical protein